MVGSQEVSGGFAVYWAMSPKRFVVKKGSNVLNSSREGEHLFHYHCFDCLESKAFLANVLRGSMIICCCDEGSDPSVLPGPGWRVFVAGWQPRLSSFSLTAGV